jgi:hypothetical protein
MALCVMPAFANVTVEQAETAMYAAEQDKSKLSDAEVVLRKAVSENPNSYKANFYLAQVLEKSNKSDAPVYMKKANTINSEKTRSAFASFMVWLFLIAAFLIGAYFAYKYYTDLKERERNAKILDQKAYEYSRKFIDAQRELQNILIHLELRDVKFNNIVYNDIDELKTTICDMVERITEGHDWSIEEAEDILSNVTMCIRFCKETFK